eukprot:1432444-Alexandrium_andersonii.AAC.1
MSIALSPGSARTASVPNCASETNTRKAWGLPSWPLPSSSLGLDARRRPPEPPVDGAVAAVSSCAGLRPPARRFAAPAVGRGGA